VIALAALLRRRLGEVTGTALAALARREGVAALAAARGHDSHGIGAAMHVAMVMVAAGAPLAPSPQARVRLLRQLHASGPLSAGEPERDQVAPMRVPGGSRGGCGRRARSVLT